METFNKVLYDNRIKKGLSLRMMAKLLGVRKSTLRNAENGYIPLPKKAMEKAKVIFGDDFETLYNESLGYTIPIEKPKKKPNKVVVKAYNFSQSIYGRIIAIILLICAIAGIVSTVVIRNKALDNPRLFSSQEYSTFYDKVKASGGEFSYSKENEYSGTFTINADNFFDYGITATSNIDSGYIFELKQESALSALNVYIFSFVYSPSSNATGSETMYCGSCTRTGVNAFTPIKMYKGVVADNKNLLTIDSKEYNEAKQIVADNLSNLDEVIEIGLNKFGIKVSTYNFVNSAISNVSQYVNAVLPIPLYIAIILTVVALFLVLFCFYEQINKLKKKKQVDEQLDECEFEIEGVVVEHYRPLPKDIKFYPPIKERWEQIIGLFLIFMGGVGTVISICNLIGFWEGSNVDLTTLGKALSAFTPISVILLLYNNLDRMSKTKGLPMSVFFFLIAGVVFYIFEVIAIRMIVGSSIDYVKDIKQDLLALLMPGNFFFGMALYSATAMFMFSTPERCKTRKQIFIWRSLVIIPISYFVIGLILNNLKNSLSTISPYIQCLFFSKNIEVSLFAFGSLLIKYVLKRDAYFTYGKENAPLYMTGNRFNMYQNVCHTILIVVIVLFAVFIPQVVSGTFTFGVGDSLYMFLLIPLMLFCAHKKEARNVTTDLIYNVCYGILMALPYVISIGLILARIIYMIF